MTKGIEKIEKDLDTQVEVSFPDKISVELVQANELRHYELFQWLVAITAPIAVGFWTAYFASSDPDKSAMLWSALAFSAITLLFLGFAIFFRRKVFHGSITKKVNLKDLK